MMIGEEEEVRMMTEFEGGSSGGDADDERVYDWEAGLPSPDDLTPLSHPLIPLHLANAFSISPEPRRTAVDVNRASQKTVSALRGSHSQQGYSSNYPCGADVASAAEVEEETEEEEGSRKTRKVDSPEEADSALRTENYSDQGKTGAAVKRPRLVWTPQLHKRFVDVVGHLGINNVVPKTIMQMMNVEELTRENVASHLQKYRLYLKRMQGLSNKGPSLSDPLFASTPVPQTLRGSGGGGQGNGHGNGQMPISMPMPYPPGMMVAMPGYMGMPPSGYHGGFESHASSYNNMMQHQQKYGGMVSYQPHVAPNEK